VSYPCSQTLIGNDASNCRCGPSTAFPQTSSVKSEFSKNVCYNWWYIEVFQRGCFFIGARWIVSYLGSFCIAISGVNTSSRLGDEPCEPTVRLPDWSELVASYSRMKSASGWTNGGQPILVCYIRKYVIILGGYSRWRPHNQKIGGCVPGIPGGVDASDSDAILLVQKNLTCCCSCCRCCCNHKHFE